MTLMTMMSTTILFLETLQTFRYLPNDSTFPANLTQPERAIHFIRHSKVKDHIITCDLVAVFIITLNYIFRFAVSPNKLKFMIFPLNVVDILYFVPAYIMWALSIKRYSSGVHQDTVVILTMCLRVLRIFRILHLTKYFKSLHILSLALQGSLKELCLMVSLLSILVLVFSNMMFYAEIQTLTFTSVPDAFWWAIITMTTVGYGDVIPHTRLGKVIASMCAISGILVIALTVPIIATNFTAYYDSMSVLTRRHTKTKSV